MLTRASVVCADRIVRHQQLEGVRVIELAYRLRVFLGQPAGNLACSTLRTARLGHVPTLFKGAGAALA